MRLTGKKWIFGIIVLFLLFVQGTGAATIGTPELWVFAERPLNGEDQLVDSTWRDVPYNEYVPLSIFCNVKEESDLMITFSADVNGEVDIRILVDDEVAVPDMVKFSRDLAWSSYSFTFLETRVPPGYHDVKVQMRINPSAPGVSSYIDCRSLSVLAVPVSSGRLGHACLDPGAGTVSMKNTSTWVDIPWSTCTVSSTEGSNLAISFSAETWTRNPTDMILVRALIDDAVASPSNVVFVIGSKEESHSFTFTRTGLSQGVHTVKMQWSVWGEGYISSRIITAFAARPDEGLWVVAPPEGPWVEPGGQSLVNLDGMTASISVYEPTSLEVVVSGEAEKVPDLYTFIDGNPMEPIDPIFANHPFKGSTQTSFTSEVDPGIHTLNVKWHNWTETAYFRDRTLVVIAPQRPAESLKGVFRPSAGNNWILDRSIDGITDFRDHYGSPADRPLVGDFNYDGSVDRVLFRSGEWIFDYNMDGSINKRDRFGMAGDIPLVGDFNYAGAMDRAVFRNGEWIVDYSMDTTVDKRDHFGMAGDIPLAGNLNDAGAPDRAVFRKGEWIMDLAWDGTINSRSQYGMAGDIPLVGDFNKNGYQDRAVFRNGEWIIDYGWDASVNARQRFGQAGDIPLVWNLPEYGSIL